MSKMKNMIILKEIKSNVIEEAIIIFKENVKIKEEQIINQGGKEIKNNNFEKDICVKEAEDIINEYIENIVSKKQENKIKLKMKFLQSLNITLIVAILLTAICAF